MQLGRNTSSNKQPAAAATKEKPFCILRWGTYPKTEGLVVKNERLATIVGCTATIVWLVTGSLYVWACLNLLFRFRLLPALGIIACMTPCFIVVSRAIEYFKMAFTENYAMGLPDNDHDSGNTPI